MDDRDAAFEHAEAGREEAEVHAALGDAVLQRLGGPPEGDRRAGLLLGDVHAAPLRVVEALHHHHLPAGIQDDDGHRPAVLLGLGLGAGHDLLGLFEVDGSAVGRGPGRGRRRLGRCHACRERHRENDHQG